MEILTRFKNSHGKVVKYFVRDNAKSKPYFISANKLVSIAHKITNADLIGGKYFRAKTGYKIDTVVEKVKPHKVSTSLTIPKKSINTCGKMPDFYGKDFIDVCFKIRAYASASKIHVERDRRTGDYRIHNSNGGNNTHLFRLIESCGWSVDKFVNSYLSALQPFELEHYQATKNKGIGETYWFVSLGYKISLVIKVTVEDSNSAVVVSFHESNINGRSASKIHRNFNLKPCAVIFDEYIDGDIPRVKFIYQHGFIRGTIQSEPNLVFKKGVALVPYSDIQAKVKEHMKAVLSNLQIYGFDMNVESVDTNFLDDLQFRYSFLSRGFHATNMICTLIDLYSQCQKTPNLLIPITACATMIVQEMPDAVRLNLQEALKIKFKNEGNALCNAIIYEL